jgi:Tfp pilus assembly protein PilV
VSTPRTLIGISVFLLALSATVGLLNSQKTRGLRAQVAQSDVARNAAEHLRITRESELKGREAAVLAANARFDETRTKVASTEAELIKTQNEKNDLETKRRENEAEIAQLRKRSDETQGGPAVTINSSTASTSELRAQLEDAKRRLEAAEHEKTLLADKIRSAPERPTPPEAEKARRLPAAGNPGIRGTVLAVNRAYNFVVLNLGGRQGVEPNSEMLVLRGGSFIGKIRISSVEPATAIGDIITSSLARGVQVQPGDTVIYAGTNS